MEGETPPPVKFTAIDAANEDDRALSRTAMRRWPARWRGINEQAKDEFAAGLIFALRAATKLVEGSGNASVDPSHVIAGINAISSIGRTAAMMEGQTQEDQHLEDKNARLDANLATERVGIAPLVIERPI